MLRRQIPAPVGRPAITEAITIAFEFR